MSIVKTIQIKILIFVHIAYCVMAWYVVIYNQQKKYSFNFMEGKTMLEKIKFSYEESEDRNNLFTSAHRKYVCIIKYNGKQYTFDYQCNPNYTTPNVKDCIECLLSDTFAYVVNKETERIFKACKKTSNAMHRLFTDEELEELESEINEY